MEDYIRSNFYKSAYPMQKETYMRIGELFKKDKGILKVNAYREGIYIEYNSYVYSKEQLSEVLTNNGYIIKKEKQVGFFKRKIQSLANSNLKLYGGKKPDCC